MVSPQTEIHVCTLHAKVPSLPDRAMCGTLSAFPLAIGSAVYSLRRDTEFHSSPHSWPESSHSRRNFFSRQSSLILRCCLIWIMERCSGAICLAALTTSRMSSDEGIGPPLVLIEWYSCHSSLAP